MAETILLVKVGMFIKGIMYGSYSVCGIYGVATVARYVRDYKESIANESLSKKA